MTQEQRRKLDVIRDRARALGVAEDMAKAAAVALCGVYHWIDADCGHRAPDYLCWERQGKSYCEPCFAAWLVTPAGKAYEEWFVRQ